MSPSGVRTATAHVVAPRIITPSMTAWPPMYFGCSEMVRLLDAGSAGYFFFAYRLLKRSTRPPVSTSFCLPV